MQHPALPSNPTVYSLNKILDQARRWLDHTETEEDYQEIEDFILELEVKLTELNYTTDYLSRCLEATR